MKTKTKLTQNEWMARGYKLFGDDMMHWRFVCPSCGNIQTGQEFKQHAGAGATPSSAYQECIGRYMLSHDAKRPCNYAGYGLFQFSPVVVVTPAGEEVQVFGFDEGLPEDTAGNPETPEVTSEPVAKVAMTHPEDHRFDRKVPREVKP